jgi:hypothetical protein
VVREGHIGKSWNSIQYHFHSAPKEEGLHLKDGQHVWKLRYLWRTIAAVAWEDWEKLNKDQT